MNKIFEKYSYHHGNLKEALINSAQIILYEEGYKELSMRKIAKMSNVSAAAPYRHFDDLDHLIYELVERGYTKLTESIGNVKRKNAGYPLIQLKKAGFAYINFAFSNQNLYKLMFEYEFPKNSIYKSVNELQRAPYSIICDLIRECRNDGMINVRSAKKAAFTAWILIHGFVLLIFGNQSFLKRLRKRDLSRIIQDQLEFWYKGIKKQD